ncbi:MAG: hypothetical protein ISS68_04720 [Desulfobacteraceae bacterium]|nr:hypothetical protein [Desulfobacteraceae bacterium]
MKKNVKGRIWWLVLAVVILAALGYYWYTRTGPETKEVLVAKEVSPVPAAGPREPVTEKDVRKEGSDVKTFPIDKAERSHQLEKNAGAPIEHLFEAGKEVSDQKTTVSEDYCTQVEQRVADFFHYLDKKDYIRQLSLETDTYTYFKQIIKRLAASPPVPAGEGINPMVMVKNIFYFSRTLDRKDLRLFKEVASNEQDTLEFNLEMFYRWFMLGKRCPNPGKVRPTFEEMYRYAGFFLNSTGGRAYLFRRSATFRLLGSYYCLLIVYQADRLGKNRYGINVFPYIKPLRKELSRYPDLEFQNEYINTLTRIENYYLQRR